MPGIEISALPAAPSAQLTDVFPIDQLPGPVTYKLSNAQLLTLFQTQIAANGQPLTEVNDTNVTLTLGGSPNTALLNPTSLTLGWIGVLSPVRGGTGVNNGASTITLGGNLTTSGAFASTFTMTGATNVTFPTSGTLATTATASGIVSSGLINQLSWYGATGTVVSGLATANNGILVTSSSGVPSIGNTVGAGLTMPSITFNSTTGTVGTTTNNNAASGSVGEFVSSFIPAASAISISANTPTDLTSISLTHGDWDVWGNITFGPAISTNIVILVGWLNSSSATIPDASLYNEIAYGTAGVVVGGARPGVIPPSQRFLLSTTTTIYISAYSTFSVSTLSMGGGIYARRRR